MSGASSRQSPPVAALEQNSLALAAGFLGLVASFDFCLANGLSGQRWTFHQDLQSLGCLVAQTIFLSLLARQALPSPAIAGVAFIGNFLLVNHVVGVYSVGHVSHNGFASAFLAGQLAFLAIWLVLGGQPLGWRALETSAAGGLLIVGWYGYAARRSTADWNLIWMSQVAAVTAAAVLLRIAGFQIRCLAEAPAGSSRLAPNNSTEREGQYRLWHLLAGLFVASCLLGLARSLGVIKPTYFADLAANEVSAADLRRGLGVGLAAALAVAFAAYCVLLRASLAARYIPAVVSAVTMGFAIHTMGPPYVVAVIATSRWNAHLPFWSPTTSQWSIWVLLNCGMAIGGIMFLHALGYRLTRNQLAGKDATNAR